MLPHLFFACYYLFLIVCFLIYSNLATSFIFLHVHVFFLFILINVACWFKHDLNIPKIFVFSILKSLSGMLLLLLFLLFYIKSSFHRNSKERSSLSRHFSNSFPCKLFISSDFVQVINFCRVFFSLSLTLFLFLNFQILFIVFVFFEKNFVELPVPSFQPVPLLYSFLLSRCNSPIYASVKTFSIFLQDIYELNISAEVLRFWCN